MNSKINEIAIKAGGIWRGGYVEQANGDSIWQEKKMVDPVDMDVEQFGQLLIAECTMVCSAIHEASVLVRGKDDSFGLGAEKCTSMILKHFGAK